MNTNEYINSGVLELYASGTLPSAEVYEVEQMVKNHPEVALELENIRETLAGFALSFPKEPRPELKARIMAAIEKEATSGKTSKEAVVRSINRKSGGVFRYLAAAVIALLLVSNAVFFQKWKESENQVSQMIAEKTEMAQNITTVKNSYNRTLADFQTVTNPSFKSIALKGLAAVPDAEALVYWNQQAGEAFIDVRKLPVPESGKQYQLWALVGGKPVDAGVFEVGDVQGLQKMKLIAQADLWAVTLEKRGGSPSPTLSAMYLISKS